MKNQRNISHVARDIKLLTVEISYRANTGHIGSALSIADILSVLYKKVLKVTKKSIKQPQRNRFILSKGHAAASLYAALYTSGIISKKVLYSFARDEGGLCEHPEISTTGVEMSTGSLGHGLGFGAGMALGLQKMYVSNSPKVNKQKVAKPMAKRVALRTNQIPHVYVLISDGECAEGSSWEAALFASRMNLNNLTVLVDYNGWQCFGKSDKISNLKPFADKWKAFGWNVGEVDGHNLKSLEKLLQKQAKNQKPTCIICHTISGKGVSSIENQLEGHYKTLTTEEYLLAKSDLMKGTHA